MKDDDDDDANARYQFWNYLSVGQFELARAVLIHHPSICAESAINIFNGNLCGMSIGFSPAMPTLAHCRWMLGIALIDMKIEIGLNSKHIFDQLELDLLCASVLLELDSIFAFELFMAPAASSKYAEFLLQLASDTELSIALIKAKPVVGRWCIEALSRCFPKRKLAENLTRTLLMDGDVNVSLKIDMASTLLLHTQVEDRCRLESELFSNSFVETLQKSDLSSKCHVYQVLLRDWADEPARVKRISEIWWKPAYSLNDHFLLQILDHSKSFLLGPQKPGHRPCEQLFHAIPRPQNVPLLRSLIILMNYQHVRLDFSLLCDLMYSFWTGQFTQRASDDRITMPPSLHLDATPYQSLVHGACLQLHFMVSVCNIVGRYASREGSEVFEMLERNDSLFCVVTGMSLSTEELGICVEESLEQLGRYELHPCLEMLHEEIHRLRCFWILCNLHSAIFKRTTTLESVVHQVGALPSRMRLVFIPVLIKFAHVYFMEFAKSDLDRYPVFLRLLFQAHASEEMDVDDPVHRDVSMLILEMEKRFELWHMMQQRIGPLKNVQGLMILPASCMVRKCLEHKDFYLAKYIVTSLNVERAFMPSILIVEHANALFLEATNDVSMPDPRFVKILGQIASIESSSPSSLVSMILFDAMLLVKTWDMFELLRQEFDKYTECHEISDIHLRFLESCGGPMRRLPRDILTPSGGGLEPVHEMLQSTYESIKRTEESFSQSLEQSIRNAKSKSRAVTIHDYFSVLLEHIRDIEALRSCLQDPTSCTIDKNHICTMYPLDLLYQSLGSPDLVQRVCTVWHLDFRLIVARACFREVESGGHSSLLTYENLEERFEYSDRLAPNLKPLRFLVRLTQIWKDFADYASTLAMLREPLDDTDWDSMFSNNKENHSVPERYLAYCGNRNVRNINPESLESVDCHYQEEILRRERERLKRSEEMPPVVTSEYGTRDATPEAPQNLKKDFQPDKHHQKEILGAQEHRETFMYGSIPQQVKWPEIKELLEELLSPAFLDLPEISRKIRVEAHRQKIAKQRANCDDSSQQALFDKQLEALNYATTWRHMLLKDRMSLGVHPRQFASSTFYCK